MESDATEHMLSQLTKTIKLALRSTQDERAILRARSAVQRFPVVEWRQRLEDFHKRSIRTSRGLAGENAYYYDMDLTGPSGLYQHQNASDLSVAGDWRNSVATLPESPNPGKNRGSITPSPLASPSLSPGPQSGFEDQRGGYPTNNGLLSAEDPNRRQNRASADSFYEDDPDRRSAQGGQVPPLYHDRDRHPSADVNPAKYIGGNPYSPNNGDIYEDDEHSEANSTAANSFAQRGPAAGQSYDNFLAAANRQIAKQTKGSRDPFMERRQSSDSLGLNSPSRPFTAHSRQSSFDSISSIMDEKGASSPLNKAIVDFTDSDGEVAQTFVQKLQILNSDNSKTDLCIEKFLMKSEKAFFEEVKRGRMSSVASVKSSRDSFVQSRAPSMIDGYRPDCEFEPECRFRFESSSDASSLLDVNELNSSPYPMGDHESAHHDQYGNSHDGHADEQQADQKPMTRIQKAMQRSVGSWPLYTILLSLGQLLSAVSY